jgi:hypothetical protein
VAFPAPFRVRQAPILLLLVLAVVAGFFVLARLGTDQNSSTGVPDASDVAAQEVDPSLEGYRNGVSPGSIPRESEISIAAASADSKRIAVADLKAPVLEVRSLVGRVLDDGGEPVGHALVEAGKGQTTHTDAEGAWRLDGIEDPPRRLLLRARADGFASGSAVVDFVGTGEVRAPTIVLRAFAPIEGRVLDTGGSPIAGVRVEISEGGASIPMEGYATTENGVFRFPDATAGEWILDVFTVSETASSRPVWRQGVTGGDRDVEVVLGQALRGSHTLRAKVVAIGSNEPPPIAEALLLEGPESDPMSLPSHGAVEWDPGTVTVKDCTPGSWRLWVRTTDKSIGFVEVLIAPDSADTEVLVEVGGRGDLAGRAVLGSLAVEGAMHIVIAPTGTDLVNGRPRWTSEASTYALVPVASDGSFQATGLVPGDVTVRLVGTGVVAEAVARVVAGQRTQVELVAGPGARIAFRIQGAQLADPRYVIFCGSKGMSSFGCDPVAFTLPSSGLLLERTFEPGIARWNLRFSAGGLTNDPAADCAVAQGGAAEIEAGQRLEVPIPYVPVQR